MQTWPINTQQFKWWRILKLARARWAEVDGDQRAAAFAYYLLLSLLPLVFMLLFLLQAAHLGRFNALYGALGSIVAFLLWLYLASCVSVFGVCFCAARAEVRDNAHGPPKLPRA